MKISIVIPTYNEKENIKELIKQVFETTNKNKLNATAIIVDDNSPDGTANIVKELQKKYNLILIENKRKYGLGKAYLTGFRKGISIGSELIFSMDGDLSHKPKHIPEFVKKINSGYDVVLGSRYVSGGGTNWGIKRKIISKGANTIAKIMLGLKINDLTTGYRCYTQKALKKIDLDSINSSGYSFLEEILFLCNKKGLRIGEIPIYFEDRRMGKSKLGKKEMMKFFWTILKMRAKSIL